MNDCAVIGVGLTQFGRFEASSLKDLGEAAITEALRDARIEPDEVEMAFVANTVSAITTPQVAIVGQVVLSQAGLGAIPVYNVDNACAGSSSALNLATHAIRASVAEVVLVVGVEKLYSPDRTRTYRGLNGAADSDWVRSTGVDVERESVFVKHVYADRLSSYAERATLAPETLARIAVKNRTHARHNARAQYRDPVTLDEVLSARVVVDPITTLMCSPIADGASAVIVASARRASDRDRAVWIRASEVSMGTAPPRPQSTISRVAERAYASAGLSATDVDVAEVHDATAFSELLAYEELGFCDLGHGAELVANGSTSLGGRLPVNPSGGLESRGHPLAATGGAQIAELVTQLRGEAGLRQVPGARVALAETAGGFVNGDTAAVAVTLLSQEPEGA
jgi:acetyl-CoA acyltransferase